LNAVFEKLCTVLEDELERQQLVLRLCVLQEEAVQQRDAELLQRRTAALNEVLSDVAQAEGERMEAAKAAVEMLQLPREQQSLSHLVASAPAPYGERLREVQAQLQSTMEESALLVRRNNRVIRRLLAKANDTLRGLYGVAGNNGNYGANGERDAASSGATLLNQAG
jgi:hypothetical protein